MVNMIGRRQFLRATAIVAGVAASARRARGEEASPIRVRPSLVELDPDGSEVETLRRGVAELKRRAREDPDDPTGWRKQARVHLEHCPHGNWFFLPWHRAYIYYFEQICREASGDPNFMLPYWDWTAHPTLPSAFLGGPENPLWHGDDNPNFPGQHSGRWIADDQPIDEEFVGPEVIEDILANPDFILAIGSDKAPRPRPMDGQDRAASVLEGWPHNNVHCEIGGDMCDFWSPLDPIFWVHHANIDRLWALWADLHPNSFPGDPEFLDFEIDDFVNADGAQAGLTVRRMVDNSELGYRYPDQQPRGQVPYLAATTPLSRPTAELAATVTDVEQVLTPDDVVQVSVDAPEELRERLMAIAEVGRAQAEGAFAMASMANPAVRIRVGDIEGRINPGYVIRAFLNCDYLNPRTSIRDPHYVGSFSFFGAGHDGEDGGHEHAARSFYLDASRALEVLGRRELYRSDAQLKVGLVTQPLGRVAKIEGMPPRLRPRQIMLDVAR